MSSTQSSGMMLASKSVLWTTKAASHTARNSRTTFPTIAREVPDNSRLDGLGMRTLGFVRRIELNRRMADSEALLQVVAQLV